jgi:hypothetical protein
MSRKKVKQTPKPVLRLPDLDFAKSTVLNTLRSSESKRSYRFAIDDFVAWYCSEPRLAFNKSVVPRYRLQLEARRLSFLPLTCGLWPFGDLRTKRPTRDCSVRSWQPAFGGSKVQNESACGWAIGLVPIK